jgi:hypothetical protein
MMESRKPPKKLLNLQEQKELIGPEKMQIHLSIK